MHPADHHKEGWGSVILVLLVIAACILCGVVIGD
jgi:hypothetical protein